MSRDQRPGKMKVVARAAPTPRRRRSDRLEDEEARAIERRRPEGATIAPPADAGVSGRLLGALFVIGCASGGAATAFWLAGGQLP